jgi:hypothetical protein
MTEIVRNLISVDLRLLFESALAGVISAGIYYFVGTLVILFITRNKK